MDIKQYAESEDMNTEYPKQQIEGLLMEINSKYLSKEYIDEKCDNIKRYFDKLR